jgi:hypothetical protein
MFSLQGQHAENMQSFKSPRCLKAAKLNPWTLHLFQASQHRLKLVKMLRLKKKENH